MGTWKLQRDHKKPGGSKKDFATESQTVRDGLSLARDHAQVFGEKCGAPKYKSRSFDVSEGNVPEGETRSTAWFAGENPQDKELVLAWVVCDDLKKNFVLERVDDRHLAVVGKSAIFFFQHD